MTALRAYETAIGPWGRGVEAAMPPRPDPIAPQGRKGAERPPARRAMLIVPPDRHCAAVAGQILAAVPTSAKALPRAAVASPTACYEGTERRVAPRAWVACQVTFRVAPTPHAIPHATGVVTNVSGTGAFIEAGRFFHPGATLEGAIRAPDGEPGAIRFSAEVVRHGRRGFGVRFIASDRARLCALVASAYSAVKTSRRSKPCPDPGGPCSIRRVGGGQR